MEPVKSSIGLNDIVMMNVVAIIGLRWIPMAAAFGASAIPLWILAAGLFFIPLGLVSAELATTWPEQGGMYRWVKRAFGEKPAFITSWLYWINNIFYYPSLLTFIAVTMAYVINPALAQSKLYVCSMILVIFWGVTLFNLRGLTIGKWLMNMGGLVGTILPGMILIGLGILSLYYWKRPCPTVYSWKTLWPDLGDFRNISTLSTLMFAMAGIELTPILAGETHRPQKTFPAAIIISAVIIVLVYVVGTVSLTLIISPERIGAASGIMDAVKILATELEIPLLIDLMVVLIVVGSLGGISIWIVGPVTMLFESTRSGIFPERLVRLNRHGVPGNAMIIQAVFISLVVLAISLLPSVNLIYEALVMMTTITYFIPYTLMFLAYMKLRRTCPEVDRPFRIPGGDWMANMIAGIGFFSVILALVLPVIPSASLTATKDIVIYELEIIGGPLIFCLIGYFLVSVPGKAGKENR